MLLKTNDLKKTYPFSENKYDKASAKTTTAAKISLTFL